MPDVAFRSTRLCQAQPELVVLPALNVHDNVTRDYVTCDLGAMLTRRHVTRKLRIAWLYSHQPALVLLGPVKSGRALDPVFKLAQQASNHIPFKSSTDFNVALLIDSHDRVRFDSRTFEILNVQFIIIDD